MATITSLNSTDSGETSRGVINTNFTNLNTDKAEIVTCLSVIPVATGRGLGESGVAVTTTTTAYFGSFVLPFKITVNKLSFSVTGYTSGTSTFDIAVYSETGQTKHIDITTAAISSTGVKTTAVSAVALNPGVYYVGIVANSAISLELLTWDLGDGALMENNPSSEPILSGTKVVTAGTLPSTFDPTSDITANGSAAPIIRLDN